MCIFTKCEVVGEAFPHGLLGFYILTSVQGVGMRNSFLVPVRSVFITFAISCPCLGVLVIILLMRVVTFAIAAPWCPLTYLNVSWSRNI